MNATLNRTTAAEYATKNTAETLKEGLVIVKENGRPDFAAMVERTKLRDTVTKLMYVCGFTYEQACHVVDQDNRKAHNDALPF